MSPELFLVCLVAGSLVTMIAIIVWAPRLWICPACGHKNQPRAVRCECGRDRAAATPATADRSDPIATWFRAAGVDLETLDRLPAVARIEVAAAGRALQAGRLDLVTKLIGSVGELPQRSRELLIEAARAHLIVREALEAGYLQLTEIGYEEATRTFEFSAYFVQNVLATRTEPVGIEALRTIVTQEHDAEGHPVDTVRVVFPEEAMARRQKGPLVAAGAKVFFMDPRNGDLVAVEE